MSISLNKKTGINLSKGSSISLEKEGAPLQNVCIGLNWGAIQRAGLVKFFAGNVSVDLDGSVAMFSGKDVYDVVYYKHLVSKDGSIRHSGDDLTGDMNGDDGLDNEVIRVNLTKVHASVDQIFFALNSFKGQDFGEIPYSKIRVFEGTPTSVKDVLATLNLSSEVEFRGNVSMVMAKLVKNGDRWKFEAIGKPVDSKDIRGIVKVIQSEFI